jgi:hypothetical protein
MHYTTLATAATPASIIYLLACGASMDEALGGIKCIDYVYAGIESMLLKMLQRSTHGGTISPRYRIALILYGDQPADIFNGFVPIERVLSKGLPRFSSGRGRADAGAAFTDALWMLRRELPQMQSHPAPMVCHFTDGLFEGVDPEPIAQELMNLSNLDGRVLVQNVFLGEGLITKDVNGIANWRGVTEAGELTGEESRKLFRMSSVLPASYVEEIQDEGYNLQLGSRMLIPGVHKDLIGLIFTAPGTTRFQ